MDKSNISTIPFFSLTGLSTPARVCDIIDGDTIVCILPFPNNNSFHKFYVRLNGIDTCEIKSQDPFLHAKALAAKNEIVTLICKENTDKQLSEYFHLYYKEIWLKCHEFDKYGRLLASIYLSPNDTESLSDHLISKKLAYSYTGAKKPTDDEIRKILS